MTLALVGNLCSGKNAVKITRSGHHYPGKRFKAWRDEAMLQLKSQVIHNKLTPGCPVHLKVEHWPGDARTRDVSGMTDALFHLLVYAGVLEDDGLVFDLTWRRQPVNRKFPKVVMTITEWSEG